MIPATPGIFVDWKQNALSAGHKNDLAKEIHAYYGNTSKAIISASLGDWLDGCLLTALKEDNAVHRGEDGVTVLFDGYLSDIDSATGGPKPAGGYATQVAELYRQVGIGLVESLRGSYIGLVLDDKANVAFAFVDRHGSRPLFERALDSGYLRLAPQVRYLARVPPRLSQLDEGAIGQFLIRGCFYKDCTLYEGVRRIPLGSTVQFQKEDVKVQRYWRLAFGHEREEISKPDALEILDALLIQAIQRTVRLWERPSLCLSGGMDSRLLLGYLIQEGVTEVPTYTYTVVPSQGDESDIAAKVAAICGCQHDVYSIEPAEFIGCAKHEVLAADGRVQMLDAPSNRWSYLGRRFDVTILGGEHFGWKSEARSYDEALRSVGCWNLDIAARIADWLKPEAAIGISASIEATLTALRKDETKGLSADDFKERIMFEERDCNLWHGYTARRLCDIEQAAPLLDEDIVTFFSTLPNALKWNKPLTLGLMKRNFPELLDIPYATAPGVPWRPSVFAKVTAENSKLREFILGKLCEELDERLASLLNIPRYNKTMKALFSDQPLPVLRKDWLRNVPGMWRVIQERPDEVGAMRAALRLLGITLYLED